MTVYGLRYHKALSIELKTQNENSVRFVHLTVYLDTGLALLYLMRQKLRALHYLFFAASLYHVIPLTL